MQCKSCDYRLWNLSSRTCPECGEPFKPSDFEFAPNNVAFCCPHCEQDYYGTDAAGHLAPRTFDCVRCGERIDMDEMVLRPAAELSEAQTRADRNPWLERGELGRIKSLTRTIGASMVRPGRLMQSTPGDRGTAAAFGFAATVAVIVALLGGGLSLVPFMLLPILLGGAGNGAWIMLSAVFGVVGFMLVGTLGWLLAWGLVTHGLLRLISQPTHGLGRTYQSLCYAQGPAIFGAVPCVGWNLLQGAWIWCVVSAIIMVKDSQHVSGPRASFAVLTFPLLGIAGIATMIVLGTMSAQRSMVQMNVGGTTGTLATALASSAAQGGSTLPAHPLEMIAAGQLQSHDLIMMTSGTTESDVPIDANTTLDDFWQLSPQQQQSLAQTAAANLPPNDEPYRFGDVVFAHRGLDPNQHPGDLWIAIVSPDPTTTPWQQHSSTDFGVALLDGSWQAMRQQAFTQALQQENQRRQQHNLPQIPDPAAMQQVAGPVSSQPPPAAPTTPAGASP